MSMSRELKIYDTFKKISLGQTLKYSHSWYNQIPLVLVLVQVMEPSLVCASAVRLIFKLAALIMMILVLVTKDLFLAHLETS